MKQLTILALVLVLFACNNKNNENNTANQIHQEWYGNWVGNFRAEEYREDVDIAYNNKINIKILSINENEVKAQSIVAGNKRLLSGIFNAITGKFTLKESGTNKYDGIFEFTISRDSLIGTWMAYDKTIAVTKSNLFIINY
jgi:hypothetical protein